MIELVPTKREISIAKRKSSEMGKLKNSITSGNGNVYGFLGELLVNRYISGKIENTYDYDIIKGKLKIDVKTKTCTSKPQPDYFCSVAAYNIRQKCDYYFFVRIMNDFSRAWLLGACSKDYFYKTARFDRKGTIDESSPFQWKFKADCYNLPVKKLWKLPSN